MMGKVIGFATLISIVILNGLLIQQGFALFYNLCCTLEFLFLGIMFLLWFKRPHYQNQFQKFLKASLRLSLNEIDQKIMDEQLIGQLYEREIARQKTTSDDYVQSLSYKSDKYIPRKDSDHEH